jgi:hypothetical protein
LFVRQLCPKIERSRKVKILKSIVVLFLLGFALSSAAVAAEGTQPAAGGAAAAGTGGAWLWLVAPIFSLVALGFAYYFYKKMMEAPEGTEKDRNCPARAPGRLCVSVQAIQRRNAGICHPFGYSGLLRV